MDRNPNLTEVTRTHAESKVVALVTGLADVEVTGSTTIRPDRIIVRYVHESDGFWRANNVKLSGRRVLKSGETGQTDHSREWFAYDGEDVARDGSSRTWGNLEQAARDLVEDLRPAGVVKLPPRA